MVGDIGISVSSFSDNFWLDAVIVLVRSLMASIKG